MRQWTLIGLTEANVSVTEIGAGPFRPCNTDDAYDLLVLYDLSIRRELRKSDILAAINDSSTDGPFGVVLRLIRIFVYQYDGSNRQSVQRQPALLCKSRGKRIAATVFRTELVAAGNCFAKSL